MNTERENGGGGRREELGGKLASMRMRHGAGGEETTHVTRGARGRSLTGVQEREEAIPTFCSGLTLSSTMREVRDREGRAGRGWGERDDEFHL